MVVFGFRLEETPIVRAYLREAHERLARPKQLTLLTGGITRVKAGLYVMVVEPFLPQRFFITGWLCFCLVAVFLLFFGYPDAAAWAFTIPSGLFVLVNFFYTKEVYRFALYLGLARKTKKARAVRFATQEVLLEVARGARRRA